MRAEFFEGLLGECGGGVLAFVGRVAGSSELRGAIRLLAVSQGGLAAVEGERARLHCGCRLPASAASGQPSAASSPRGGHRGGGRRPGGGWLVGPSTVHPPASCRWSTPGRCSGTATGGAGFSRWGSLRASRAFRRARMEPLTPQEAEHTTWTSTTGSRGKEGMSRERPTAARSGGCRGRCRPLTAGGQPCPASAIRSRRAFQRWRGRCPPAGAVDDARPAYRAGDPSAGAAGGARLSPTAGRSRRPGGRVRCRARVPGLAGRSRGGRPPGRGTALRRADRPA